MEFKRVAAASCVVVLLAGCADTGFGPREGVGTVVGAVAGGLLGSQFGSGSGQVIAAATGAAIGALLGNEIGRRLDEADRQRAWKAQYSALEHGRTGAPVNWDNPDNGNRGEVVPGPAYTVNNSACRDYTHTVYIDGKPQTVRGTACREPDGTWRAVS